MASLPLTHMFPPPHMAPPPPLPPGWSEHVAPGGQLYYYNALTKESTYVRPLPMFPIPPMASAIPPPESKKKKKEKPKIKTLIPGTLWMRVVTTEGNVFYTHTERKESVWKVPDEIKDALARLEHEEKEKEEKEKERRRKEEEERKLAVEREVERLKKEVEESAGKRKAEEEDTMALDEVTVTKKARVGEESDRDKEALDEDEEKEDDEEDDEEGEEKEWQREAVAQLAAEAEEKEHQREGEQEARRREEELEKEELKQREEEKGALEVEAPNRVDLSLEEAKAMFKTLLREKDINPLLPWDTALLEFISDPRYLLLPSVSSRRDAFDEYCRDRARELRQAKVQELSVAAAEEKRDPKGEFDKLLHEEVKSTRTSWIEWRRAWKKDHRFWGWGRDDREREKRFREWLKELGEQKKKAAQKAEENFFALLKEKAEIRENSTWKEVKRGLDKDPRYDAVGSASLREELFNSYMRVVSTRPVKAGGKNGTEVEATDRESQKSKDKERKERAVKEREERVKRERNRNEVEMARSRSALSREESEREFLTLLTDAIREPMATWDSSVSQLRTDYRFINSALTTDQKLALFRRHVTSLCTKQTKALHALFAAHAPALETSFSTLPLKSIQSSLPATKLHLDAEHDPNADALENEFRLWNDERMAHATREFQEMLDENSFVEFWGRIRKMQERGESAPGMNIEVGAEDLAGEEGGGDENKIDLKSLARSVNAKEIEKVLKSDKRFAIFDHMPKQREQWIRTHVEKLAAPKLSVHVPDQGQ